MCWLQWVNNAGRSGKGASQLCCRRQDRGRSACGCRVVDGLLIADKEEGMVAADESGNPDRAADGTSKLIALKRVDRFNAVDIGEVVCGIKGAVAEKLEQIAVVLAASALGDNVDHTTGILAILGAVVAGLNAKLLQRIGHWKWSVDVGVFVHIIAAIK